MIVLVRPIASLETGHRLHEPGLEGEVVAASRASLVGECEHDRPTLGGRAALIPAAVQPTGVERKRVAGREHRAHGSWYFVKPVLGTVQLSHGIFDIRVPHCVRLRDVLDMLGVIQQRTPGDLDAREVSAVFAVAKITDNLRSFYFKDKSM
jgi:hypothetical protein